MNEGNGSRLLIDEAPLQILPSLAVAIGLNEAIVLQQIHYWLRTSGKEQDGSLWIYNSYEEWHKQFPFWSLHTVRRTISSLEQSGIVRSANFNGSSMDRTKWYTIDYAALDAASSEYARPSDQDEHMPSPSGEYARPSDQDGQAQVSPMDTCNGSKWAVVNGTETTTEITTETTGAAPTRSARSDGSAENQVVSPNPVKVLIDCGLNRNQALVSIRKRDFPADLLTRIAQWRKECRADRPAAVLWSYLKDGLLPDDLGQEKPKDRTPRLPDGSVDWKRYDEIISNDPGYYIRQR